MSFEGGAGAPAPENKNRTYLIIGVAAALLLCCCCVVLAVGLWACGDLLMGTATSCAF